MTNPLISVDGAEPIEMTDEEALLLVPADEIIADGVRSRRDYLLENEVDKIAGNALRWTSLNAEQQQAWADYRKALLDVPEQDGFPHDVIWPEKPEV
jgi:hypothetical protein